MVKACICVSLVVLFAGCGSGQKKHVSNDFINSPITDDSIRWPYSPPPAQLYSILEHEVLQTNLVTVTIEGDVKHQGKTRIRRELSKQSVYDAGGGWGGYSSYGLKPRSISIYRVDQGLTNKWKIQFNDMTKPEWQTFLFEEGDWVWVHTLM